MNPNPTIRDLVPEEISDEELTSYVERRKLERLMTYGRDFGCYLCKTDENCIDCTEQEEEAI